MKIPESIRIGGVDYAVKFDERVTDGISSCNGMIDYATSEIFIATDKGLGHQAQCQTFLHEILHGIAYHANLDISKDNKELIIDTIAKGLYQVLQDNGCKLFDIKK